MKKIFTFLVPMAIGITLTASAFAQSPEKMSYQAVIPTRNDALTLFAIHEQRIKAVDSLFLADLALKPTTRLTKNLSKSTALRFQSDFHS